MQDKPVSYKKTGGLDNTHHGGSGRRTWLTPGTEPTNMSECLLVSGQTDSFGLLLRGARQYRRRYFDAVLSRSRFGYLSFHLLYHSDALSIREEGLNERD